MSINRMQKHSFHVLRDYLQRFKGEHFDLFIQTHTHKYILCNRRRLLTYKRFHIVKILKALNLDSIM